MNTLPLRRLGAALLFLPVAAPAQSLLPNGDFEQGAAGWSHFVPAESASAGASFTVETDSPRSGLRVARLSSDSFARHAIGVSRIPVVPGERYRVSGWVRADLDTGVGPGTPGALIRLTLTNAAGTDAPGGHLYVGPDNWVGRTIPPASGLQPHWTLLKAVVAIPEGVAGVTPQFFAWRALGSVYFDGLVFEKVAASTPLTPETGTEVLTNPGFEDNLSGWTHFIPSESAGAGAVFESNATGARSARLRSLQPARHGFQPSNPGAGIDVAPGERYRLSAWVRAGGDAVFSSNTPGVLIRLTLRDAAGADIPSGHLYVGAGGRAAREPGAILRFPLSPEWARIEAVVAIPDGAEKATPSFFVWKAGGTVDFDDLSFVKVSSGTPLSPSDTPAAVLLTTEWQAELFDALDLSLPGLQTVRQALFASDLPAARAALAAWLRQRPGSYATLAPVDPAQPDALFAYNAVRADNAAFGRVTPSDLAELWHTFERNVIDWYHNETHDHPGVAYNREWQWQLNRMSFWSDMANAYRATGDEKYPRAWVTQFRSFIAQCPSPAAVANHPDSAWRTIECGLRMRDSWPRAFQAFIRSPSVTDEDLLLFLHSSLRHARYLWRFPSAWGNWLTMEMSGLHAIGTLFPEFKDAAAWRTLAIQTLHQDIARQFPPDGFHFEYSPGYHNVALDSILAIPRLAQITGRLGEIPAGYISSLERAYDANLHLVTPDRSLPALNDSWPANVRGIFRKALEFFPARQDYRWFATAGSEGMPPAAASWKFDHAGYCVMRSGWETDANYLVFDGGLPGYAHAHQDKLNVALWAYGREILFDGGGGSYENSPWRAYAVDSFSHNVVLVDGKPQRRSLLDGSVNFARTPQDIAWASTPAWDFAAATYDGAYAQTNIMGGPQPAGPAVHTRRVLFAKPDLAIVADTLSPVDGATHTYEARWHLLSTLTSLNPSTWAVVTADPGRPNLAVIPLRTDGLVVRSVSAQTEPKLLGWHVRKDMDPQYVPATTVTHTRSGSGIQTFITLLLPLRPGQPGPVQSVADIDATTVRVTFAGGGGLTITVPAAPAALITVVRD